MPADEGRGDHHLSEGGAQLRVDVGEARVAETDVAEIGDPVHARRRAELVARGLHGGAEGVEGRVIDDEVQVGKVLGRALEVTRMPVLLDPALERQPLVETDVPDAEAARGLQHGVRDLLVVDPPRLRRVAEGQPRVTLPRADPEVGGLTPHLVKIRRALVGGHQPVRDEALRGGQPVDHVPCLRHLVRRQDVARLGRRWNAADHGDRGVAVQKHLLDVVAEIEIVHGAAILLELGVPGATDTAQAKEILKLPRRGDVMGLDVEDELARRLPRVGRRRLDRLDGIDLEESPEDRVQGEEGRGHPRAGRQEVAPAHAQPARVRSGCLLQQRGDPCLLRRLGQRDVFLVGDNTRGKRRESIGLRVQPPLPNPSTLAHLPSSLPAFRRGHWMM